MLILSAPAEDPELSNGWAVSTSPDEVRCRRPLPCAGDAGLNVLCMLPVSPVEPCASQCHAS